MSGWLGEFVQGAVAKTQAGLGDITEGIKDKLKEVRRLSPEFVSCPSGLPHFLLLKKCLSRLVISAADVYVLSDYPTHSLPSLSFCYGACRSCAYLSVPEKGGG